MKNLIASYQLANGMKILEMVTPSEAITLIQTGRYGDHYAPNAAIFDTRRRLKGERRSDWDETIPEEYREWWHDDDLNQIELPLDHENCDIPQ